jgi:hypothetical protein
MASLQEGPGEPASRPNREHLRATPVLTVVAISDTIKALLDE